LHRHCLLGQTEALVEQELLLVPLNPAAQVVRALSAIPEKMAAAFLRVMAGAAAVAGRAAALAALAALVLTLFRMAVRVALAD
jgi:hypothetical protein